ncbi:hypothetical protein BBJ28_00001505 [Nothophytophthora sp. Chile5]|nr:hypothetical protein BBJ28_00001505 [Nothophytophthora sp. Chile5]
MFVLTRLSDVIPVAPELFDADYTQVLVEEIDRKYANKVLADVGLCVTMYDFVHIGDALVHPADGTSHSQGTDWLRPHPLAAAGLRLTDVRRLRSSGVPDGGVPPLCGRSAQGPHRELHGGAHQRYGRLCGEPHVLLGLRANAMLLPVSMDFVQDIIIPSYALQTPSYFDTAERLWVRGCVCSHSDPLVWDSAEKFYMDLHEEIRFRVTNINFTRVTKTAKGIQATTTEASDKGDNDAGDMRQSLARRRSSSTMPSAAEAMALKSRAEVQLLNVLNQKRARSASLYLKEEQQKAQQAGDLKHAHEPDAFRHSAATSAPSDTAQLIAGIRQLEDNFFTVGAEENQKLHECEGADQIELNAAHRRDRHMQAQMLYGSEVKEISDDMEVSILLAADRVKEALATIDTRIREAGCLLADNELLLASMNEGILRMWRDMEALCEQRGDEVDQFAVQLEQIEQIRTQRVRVGLERLTRSLMDTAHALPPEVERIIEAEVYEVNTVVISNRRVYGDLVAKMAAANVDVFVSSRLAWEQGQIHWRRLRHDHAIATFLATLNSPLFTDSEERRLVLQEIRVFQKSLHTEGRLAALKRLEDAGAVLSSEQAKQILDDLTTTQQFEEERNQSFFSDLRTVHESKACAVQTLQEALRLDLHGFGAMAKEGDIVKAKDALVELLSDDSLEDLFRVAGGLRAELDILAKRLNVADLIYSANLEPLVKLVEILLSALPLEGVMATQGKEAGRKAVQATLERIRKASKLEIMALLPPLQAQVLALRNLDEMGTTFKAEVEAVMAQLDAIIQECGASLESTASTALTALTTACGSEPNAIEPSSTAGALAGRTQLRPPSGAAPESSFRRSSVSIGGDPTATNKPCDTNATQSCSGGVVDFQAIRKVQRRLGILVYASELSPPLQQHLQFILKQLLVQANANFVVDRAIAQECDRVIETRLQESRLLLEEMGRRMEQQSALLHDQSEKLARFVLNVVLCMEQSADRIQYVNLSVMGLLDTLKEDNEDALAALELQFNQSCSRLRHSPNDTVLRDELQRSWDLLLRIEAENRMFHKRVLLAADNNVTAIDSQKNLHLCRLCGFFGLELLTPSTGADTDALNLDYFLSAQYVEKLVNPPPIDPGAEDSSTLEAAPAAVSEGRSHDPGEVNGVSSSSTCETAGPTAGHGTNRRKSPEPAEVGAETALPAEDGFRASSGLELRVVLSLADLANSILHRSDGKSEEGELKGGEETGLGHATGPTIPNGLQHQVSGARAEDGENDSSAIERTTDNWAAVKCGLIERIHSDFLHLEIPTGAVISLLGSFRDAILSRYDSDTREIAVQTGESRGQRHADATLLLEERLRVHWPRRGRLDVQLYQPRMSELLAHRQRQERQLQGIWKKVDAQQEAFARKAEEALAHVEQTRRAQITSQAQLPLQLSLAALQGLEVKTKKRLGVFKAEGMEMLAVLRSMTAIDTSNLRTACQDYIRACSSQLFPDLTSCEIISGSDYHPAEIAAIQEKLAAMEAQAHEQMAEREKSITALNRSQEQVLGTWQAFKERYQACLQNLAMREGLGQTFGLPRRTAQERYRSETTRCEERSAAIDGLLVSLQDLADGGGRLETSETDPSVDLTGNALRLLMQLRAKLYHRGMYFDFLKYPSQLELKPIEFHAHATAKGERSHHAICDREVVDEEDTVLLIFFLEFVDQLSTRCREETKALYHQEGKADELPLEGVPVALAEYFSSLRQKAQAYVLQQETAYREQVCLFSELLVTVPGVVVTNFMNRAKHQMRRRISDVTRDIDGECKSWMELKTKHTLELRPHLCSPNNAALLLELGERERLRSASAQAALRRYRSQFVAKQIEVSSELEEGLVALCQCLMALLDSSVMSLDDLKSFSGEDPPKIKRKSLKRLRKLARVNEFGDPREVKRAGGELEKLQQCGEAPRFPLRLWPGIPSFGLYALWEEVKADILEKEITNVIIQDTDAPVAGASIDKAIQELDCGTSSGNDGACTALLTPAHRALVSVRDAAYAEFVRFCREESQTLLQSLYERFQDELKWIQSWEQGISSMRLQRGTQQQQGPDKLPDTTACQEQ